MLNAEELGVTKANVDERLKSDNPEIRRLLGAEGNFGEAARARPTTGPIASSSTSAITARSSNATSAQGSPLKIARGLNALWTKGGLQYAPPIR